MKENSQKLKFYIKFIFISLYKILASVNFPSLFSIYTRMIDKKEKKLGKNIFS